jgi:hypothetical protein
MLIERFATVIFAAIALAGCIAEFDDVSATPEYRKVIGELCRVQTSLNAHGVTLNVERNKKTDVIALTSLNLSGPEITFSTRLFTETKLEIVGVRKCKNCPFEDRIEYRVRSQPMPREFADAPVYMNLQRVAPEAISCNTLRGQWSAK